MPQRLQALRMHNAQAISGALGVRHDMGSLRMQLPKSASRTAANVQTQDLA